MFLLSNKAICQDMGNKGRLKVEDKFYYVIFQTASDGILLHRIKYNQRQIQKFECFLHIQKFECQMFEYSYTCYTAIRMLYYYYCHYHKTLPICRIGDWENAQVTFTIIHYLQFLLPIGNYIKIKNYFNSN
jgi:hypothetical protein